HTGNPVANQRGPVLFDPQSPNRLLVAFEQTHYMNQGPVPSPTGDYILGVGGSVDVARSEDAGATFSWVSTALAVPPGQEALTIGLLGSGTDVIVIAAVVNDADFFSSLATGSPVPQYLYSIRSTDGGSTFGSPHPIGIYNGGP